LEVLLPTVGSRVSGKIETKKFNFISVIN
jgi:hypothetical protein